MLWVVRKCRRQARTEQNSGGEKEGREGGEEEEKNGYGGGRAQRKEAGERSRGTVTGL